MSRALCDTLDRVCNGDGDSFLDNIADVLKNAQLERANLLSKRDAVCAQVPVLLNKLTEQTKNSVKTSEDLEKERLEVSGELENLRKNPDGIMNTLQGLISTHQTYAATVTYVMTVSKLLEYKRKVEVEAERKNLEGALDSFALMSELSEAISTLSKCSRLGTFASESTTVAGEILREKLSIGVNDALTQLQWPKPLSPAQLSTSPPDKAPGSHTGGGSVGDSSSFGKFISAARLCAKWELLIYHVNPDSKKSIPKHTLLLIETLARPIRTRFHFHFEGNRKTNRKDKPEWFFTFLINHLRDHQAFIGGNVQDVLDETGLHVYNAFTDFTTEMVSLAREKIRKTFPQITGSPSLLSHAIDEILSFETTLRDTYTYPDDLPMCLDVICSDAELFDKWLDVESTLAVDEFGATVNDEAAWSLHFGEQADVDDFKTTRSAARVIAILQGVTARFSAVADKSQQLRFVDVIQRRLLEEYHEHIEVIFTGELKRVLAWGHQAIDKWPRASALVNSLDYCQHIMRDWGEDVTFLELQNHAEQSRADSSSEQGGDDGEGGRHGGQQDDSDYDGLSGTVFDLLVSDYCSLRDDFIKYLVDVVANAFKQEGSAYKKKVKFERAEYSQHHIDGQLSISREFTQALVGLKEFLHCAEANLGKSAFGLFWRQLSEKLNQYLYKDVLERKLFDSAASGEQFAHDIFSVYLLFKPFTSRPENFFKETKESAYLLCLPKDRILEIKQRISQCLGTMDPRSETELYEHLAKMKIFKLGPSQVLEVLAKRVDCDIDSDSDE